MSLHGILKLDNTDIDVTVKNGQVTLQGTVEMYGKKWAAERDALRISGVRGLTNDLTVMPLMSQLSADADIKRHLLDVLMFDSSVPHESIQVHVEDGWVVLRGSADWYYQRSAAEADAWRILGVKGWTTKSRFCSRRRQQTTSNRESGRH